MAELDLEAEYSRDPRAFRRLLNEFGVFAQLPITNEDDLQYEDIIRYRKFWRWVIDQAVLDIIDEYKVTRREKQALSWVNGMDKSSGKDFNYVCRLADLPFSFVTNHINLIKRTKDKLTKNGSINIYQRKNKMVSK